MEQTRQTLRHIQNIDKDQTQLKKNEPGKDIVGFFDGERTAGFDSGMFSLIASNPSQYCCCNKTKWNSDFLRKRHQDFKIKPIPFRNYFFYAQPPIVGCKPHKAGLNRWEYL